MAELTREARPSDLEWAKFRRSLGGREPTPAEMMREERELDRPLYAWGSPLGRFMLLLADSDRAVRERWPEKWELKIDPDLETCPRAPAIWAAG